MSPRRWSVGAVRVSTSPFFPRAASRRNDRCSATRVAGDLTRFIRAYFDTTTGPKTAPESYARIAAALERSPAEVLFVSDVAAELDAARTAGMKTALCVRPPGTDTAGGTHPSIREFDQLTP